MKVVLISVLILVLVAAGWAVWKFSGNDWWEGFGKKEQVEKPDLERYEQLVAELGSWRGELAAKHEAAKNEQERGAIAQDARLILELMMPEMMKCWLGTRYDFNGTAEKPGKGKVACGYFVSTVLRDAGFVVDRYRLAQQPSENIIRSFVKADFCQLQAGADFDEYTNRLSKMDRGIYLVGLDSHVGFLVNGSEDWRFFHSSGWKERGVVKEELKKAGALRHSNWRMIGALSADPSAIQMWLGGAKVPVRQ